jgi:hypothetical protein
MFKPKIRARQGVSSMADHFPSKKVVWGLAVGNKNCPFGGGSPS